MGVKYYRVCELLPILWHHTLMDDASLASPAHNRVFESKPHWHALLQLTFSHDGERSFLAHKKHLGPLVLQKSLHPEGKQVCHGIIVHPPGGVAGGDALELKVQVATNAKALLTTPGAGKWYKANGLLASQHVQADVAENGCLEWLPQETIMFNGARAQFHADVHLSADARYVTWDIVCFGRQAQQEQWLDGAYQQRVKVYRQGRLIWQERAHHAPHATVMRARTGLAGQAVNATFIVVAGKVPASVLALCRAVALPLGMDSIARAGMTALPEVFCARYVGSSSQAAKCYFEALWACLRPWYLQMPVVRPRIWNT